MKKTQISISLMILLILTIYLPNTFAHEISYTTLKGHTDYVWSVAFSPDGALLASGSGDDTIRLWDATTGQHIRTLTGHTASVWSVAFSPDGALLASGSGDDTIRLWDATTGQHIRTLTGHTYWVSSVAFSPADGSLLASGSGDNTIRLWDATTGQHIRTLTGHTDWVNSVAFSPADGSLLASGSSDNTIRLWDATTGQHIRTLTGHTDWVRSVSFSPDGSLLASGSSDKTIRLWDATTGQHIRTLTGHTDRVRSVSFSPDGSMLASGSSDKTIRLWDATTGQHIRTLTGHTDRVRSVSFSPDGSMLASGSSDKTIRGVEKTIRLWKAPATRVNITALPIDAAAIGDRLTLNINITSGKDITGFQAKVLFDTTALRYVSSANGDYLPDDSFFVAPVVDGNEVLLGATSVNDSSSGDGTLATLTFEFIAIKESTLTLSSSRIVNSVGKHLPHFDQVNSMVVGGPRLREDVNLDGVVDILDLTLVAASFGKSSVTHIMEIGDVNKDGVIDIDDLIMISILNFELDLAADSSGGLSSSQQRAWYDILDNITSTVPGPRNPADVNKDGIIDIVDLVLVAGALGNKAAAPAAWARYENMFRKSDVQQWLSQAQKLNLTDATFQQGILFLEQLLAALTPKETELLANYPNPFNPETWIPYQLAKASDVKLTIYDINGRVVRDLDLGHQRAGIYHSRNRAAYWDGKNALGESVASGVYFYTLTAGDFTVTRKMLIRK